MKKVSQGRGESGFTLVEVIVAALILSFTIFATWRVISLSAGSITMQERRLKALCLARAHLARVEGIDFSKAVPENFIVSPDKKHKLQSIDYESQIVDINGSGKIDTGDFKLYLNDGTDIPSSTGWSYNSTNLEIENIPETCGGREVSEISLKYKYYHLIDEGGTIPPSNGEGIKEKVIKLTTNVGDTDGDGTAGEKEDILGYDYTTSSSLSPLSYNNYNKNDRELVFDDSKKGHSVWIYYLPKRDNNDNPTENSIVGVVEGLFCEPEPDETTTGAVTSTNKITSMKKITVTEFWRQREKIKSEKVETFIRR